MDTISRLLNLEIQAWRNQSYRTFDIEVEVHPAVGANTIWEMAGPGTLRKIGHDKYSFNFYGTPGRTLPVRKRNNSIVVLYRGQWLHVHAYLEKLLPFALAHAGVKYPGLESQQYHWDNQARWWQRNGKSFALLNLPPELRERIYESALVKTARPYPKHKARRLGQNLSVLIKRQPNVNVMLVNKQIYKEASHVFYQQAPFLIEHLGVWRRMLSHNVLSENVQKLELSLSHYGMCELFGLYFQDATFEFWSGPEARALRELRLKQLTLTFAAPSLITEALWHVGACQVKVVDLIIQAAWPFIRGYPIRLRGYIKNNQRGRVEADALIAQQQFEAWSRLRVACGYATNRLADYDKHLQEAKTDEAGGVRLDGRVVDDEEPDNFGYEVPVVRGAPLCFCDPPCTVKDWTAE